jgi:hypothetical protein
MSSATVLAGLTAAQCKEKQSVVEEAADKVGKLPRRKLGYSNREVSILIGAGGMPLLATEAAILCGVNYWHKANRWSKEEVPADILKNREAHYCQVTVDRVGGNHYQGHLDEDEHVAYVKESLKQTGLGYYDDMQFHFGYHNIKELENDKNFVRAFERLKKQGLVKHLCLSQHSYAGNSRVPEGQGAAEILTAVVKDGLYEHGQFIYSYGDDAEINEFIDLAAGKNFGTIAMKTARGIGRMKQDEAFMKKLPKGVSPHNALTRWLTTKTKLTAAVIRIRNLDEFTDTFSGAGKTLQAHHSRALEIMTAQADKTACRMCSKCQPHCPQQVPVTEILRFERYALDDHDRHKAKQLYADMPVKADQCQQCGNCVQHCPLNLNIPQKLFEAHSLLS